MLRGVDPAISPDLLHIPCAHSVSPAKVAVGPNSELPSSRWRIGNLPHASG